MLQRPPAPTRTALYLAVTFGLVTAGCSSGGSAGGCTKDTDCKGDRVCASGQCVETPTKDPPAVQQPGMQPQPGVLQQPVAQPEPAPEPAPEPEPAPAPAVDPYAMANDGLPVDIPAPGSAVPTVAEWNAVPREVTVRGSSRLNCETKMLREWLRVTCRQNFMGQPIDVQHTEQSGQQAFKIALADRTSVVVQVVRGRTYRAEYTWDNGGSHNGAELNVSWPPGAPRPSFFFNEGE